MKDHCHTRTALRSYVNSGVVPSIASGVVARIACFLLVYCVNASVSVEG